MRVVRHAPLLLLLLVVAALVIAVSARPDLDRSRDDVDRRWAVLQPALQQRYAVLAIATAAVQSAPGPVHDLVVQLDSGLSQWRDVLRDRGTAPKVTAANTLEDLGRRLGLVVHGSQRLAGDPKTVGPIDAYAQLPAPAAAVGFDDAVRAYQRERSGPARRVAAEVMGYGEIAAYDLPST